MMCIHTRICLARREQWWVMMSKNTNNFLKFKWYRSKLSVRAYLPANNGKEQNYRVWSVLKQYSSQVLLIFIFYHSTCQNITKGIRPAITWGGGKQHFSAFYFWHGKLLQNMYMSINVSLIRGKSWNTRSFPPIEIIIFSTLQYVLLFTRSFSTRSL